MKYFGTDGFRGRVNDVLTVDHAVMTGKFLGWYFSRDGHTPRCVIGKDTRRSCYMYEYALVAGLTSTGAHVDMLHVTTTPSVAYVTRVNGYDFGIMITASHNPYSDNGIKIIDSDGFKMSEDVLEKIESYIDGETEIELADHSRVGKCSDYIQGRNKYIGYLASSTNISLRGYRIGLDCANGASFMIARNAFELLGADVTVINDRPDGYNINVDCGSTHPERLQELVKMENLDAGFAFDGDADRCIAVDENGELVDGDLIIYLCGNYLKELGMLSKDTVVTTVMTNMGITKALEERGIKNVQVSVGDKYVSAEMLKNGYSIGGEQSGHVIFNKFATTGDGILTAIQVMNVIENKKTTLSSLTGGITRFPQYMENVKVADKDKAMTNPALLESMKKWEEYFGNEGRIVLRPSGTEPIVRVMVECRDEDTCVRSVKEMADTIRE